MWRHVTNIPNWIDCYSTRWSDSYPCDAAVVQRKPQPSLGWELESTTNEVTYYVCMTGQNFVAILLLAGLSAIKVSSKRSFNPCTIFVKLLNIIRWERSDWESSSILDSNRHVVEQQKAVVPEWVLTWASGRQFGLSGTGFMGAPSLRKSQVSTGTSPRCLDMTDAVFLALVIEDWIILEYGTASDLSLFAVNSACSQPYFEVWFSDSNQLRLASDLQTVTCLDYSMASNKLIIIY